MVDMVGIVVLKAAIYSFPTLHIAENLSPNTQEAEVASSLEKQQKYPQEEESSTFKRKH